MLRLFEEVHENSHPRSHNKMQRVLAVTCGYTVSPDVETKKNLFKFRKSLVNMTRFVLA